MKLSPPEERIVAAYRRRWTREYVRRKLQSDPVYSAVAATLTGRKGSLLDLGCGLGLLALYLRAHGFRQQLTGVDRDVSKIAQARDAMVALGISGVSLLEQDLRARADFSGSVLLLDVLHYFPAVDQDQLLRQAAEYAKESGSVVVVRECLRDKSWRYRATVVQEQFSRAIRWLKGETMQFPLRESIVAVMENSGLTTVDIRPLWGATPFNNYLMVFERR